MQSQRRARLSEKANAPSLGDHLKEYFARPDVIEQLEPVGRIGDGTLRAFVGFFAMAGALLQGIASAPPSAGYEPWLTEHEFDRTPARAMAAIVVSAGRRVAKNAKRRPVVVEAIRFLARRSRASKPVFRRVSDLLAAWEDTSVIEEMFSKAGCDESEFIRSLKAVAAGDQASYGRLREIAAGLTPRLTMRRGPKITASSAAHEFFLRELVQPRQKVTWSRDELNKRFTDPVTRATSREFDDPSFDPRPACRRVNALKAEN
jgi:hypothetical protein